MPLCQYEAYRLDEFNHPPHHQDLAVREVDLNPTVRHTTGTRQPPWDVYTGPGGVVAAPEPALEDRMIPTAQAKRENSSRASQGARAVLSNVPAHDGVHIDAYRSDTTNC